VRDAETTTTNDRAQRFPHSSLNQVIDHKGEYVLSIIDSLSKGFQTVNRYWWLLLIPILLDVFLWVGPQASVQEIMQGNLEKLEAEKTKTSTEEMAEWLDLFYTTLQEASSQYNGFSALRVGTLGIPSLMSWRETLLGSPSIYETLWIFFSLLTNKPDLLVSVPDATFIELIVWQFPHEALWLLTSVFLTSIGILIGCTYLISIARRLIDPEEPWAFWPRVLKLGVHFVLFWILRVLFLVITGIPFMLILLALTALSPALAALFGLVVIGITAWFSFYGVFFIASMVVNNTSAWRAIWNSFNIVLRNFGSTLWLFLLINLIGGGLTILWQKLSTGSWLTLVGIIGNAYVGSSLIAASLIFYQDRYTKWRENIANLLTKRGKRPA
jgi:hypothetical protein